MGGGLMQLVAYGAQDIYLTGNPQITFFKVVYRRHTNFSIESIQQTFNGTADFGKKVSCTISRNGDLVHRIYLQATLPEVTTETNSAERWVDWIGEKLINFVEIEIGGQRIDRHYGEWLHIWNQLSNNPGHEEGYHRMVGNVPKLVSTKTTDSTTTTIESTELYVPLQFWFCRNPGLALPLISLQYHEVKINIEFQELKNLYLRFSSAVGDPATPNSLQSSEASLVEASLWVDYIFLDTDERRRFAQLSHEYLIEQLQFPGEETISSATAKIRLNFNHPVKELVWVVQKQNSIDKLQGFNYTDRLDSTPLLTHSPLGNTLLSGLAANLEAVDTSSTLSLQILNGDTGVNCCSRARLQLNGQDRFAERSGDYFNYVQPYNHHNRTPHVGINVYSFGLKPEEHQPSGTCNFSRIDNANLFLNVTSNTLNKGTVSQTNGIIRENLGTTSADNAKVRIYATNYNVLRIMSGMGGLAYSN